MLDLEKEDLQIVNEILSTHLPDMEIWAYGSRTTGKAHKSSDLDLVVIHPKNPELPQKNIATVKAAFRESNLPIFVDLHDWAYLPQDFRDVINQHHVVIKKARE